MSINISTHQRDREVERESKSTGRESLVRNVEKGTERKPTQKLIGRLLILFNPITIPIHKRQGDSDRKRERVHRERD